MKTIIITLLFLVFNTCFGQGNEPDYNLVKTEAFLMDYCFPQDTVFAQVSPIEEQLLSLLEAYERECFADSSKEFLTIWDFRTKEKAEKYLESIKEYGNYEFEVKYDGYSKTWIVLVWKWVHSPFPYKDLVEFLRKRVN